MSRPTDGDRKEIGRALQRMGFLRRARIDGFQSPPAVLRELAQARADVLVGYPGMLDRLTAPELAPLRTGIRPRVVLTGGEVLTGAVRARLRAAFGAEVVESYASHEFPLLAWSCREGEGLHVCDDGVVLEVLRDGRPAAPGEQGEVVVTNLHAYTMPFIRYRLGDLAVRGAGCACGRPFSTIGAIDGRVIDYFPLPNGRALHPYEIIRPLVIGGDDWIRRYQLVQERADRIVLRVVAAPPPPAARLAEIGCSVRSLLGPDVRFSVELVDEIPFSDSGKSRASWTMVRPATDA